VDLKDSTSINAIVVIKCQLFGWQSTYTSWSSIRNHIRFLMRRTYKGVKKSICIKQHIQQSRERFRMVRSTNDWILRIVIYDFYWSYGIINLQNRNESSFLQSFDCSTGYSVGSSILVICLISRVLHWF